MTTLDNTRQWTKLAGIKNMSRLQVDQALALVENAGEFPAQPQYILLATGMAQAVENGMSTSIPSLAEDILAQQATRIKRYRKEAYPLSDKQVNVILREMRRWDAN